MSFLGKLMAASRKKRLKLFRELVMPCGRELVIDLGGSFKTPAELDF